MVPSIASIENLIASDPAGRDVFSLVLADQLRLAAQSLRLAGRVGIVAGRFRPKINAGQVDGPGGPSGAKVVGRALEQLNIQVDYIADESNATVLEAIGISPLLNTSDYMDTARPTHLLSIGRVGRTENGRYHDTNGIDITETTAPLDELFLQSTERGRTTIGVGHAANEIGMGKVFAPRATNNLQSGAQPPSDATTAAAYATTSTTIETVFSIASGVSDWGAYGLAGALSMLAQKDLLPKPSEMAADQERMLSLTGTREQAVDGLNLAQSVRMLEEIRRQIVPSPLARRSPLRVAVLGYGVSGRAAAALLAQRGHGVSVSDQTQVTVAQGATLRGIETGGHTIDFLQHNDLIVASPGVRSDAPIRDQLHARGVPVMSELELAYQLCQRELIAVTGTIGKRTTVELLQRTFEAAGRKLTIGGNRGEPFSELVRDREALHPIALAVSSFQLETIVNFRPQIAIILNINEAHLDRHRTIAEYTRIKSRIFMNQRPSEALILSYDNQYARPLARKRQGRTFFVSAKQPVDRGAWLLHGNVHLNIDGTTHDLGPADPEYPENLLVSLVAAALTDIPINKLSVLLGQLQPPPVGMG